MLQYVVEGGYKLKGEIRNSGSKNASLPILATAILNPNPVTFYNVPNIEDTKTILKILRFLGCKVSRECDKITISSKNMKKTEIPEELMQKCRSTVILAGAILGRFKKATFSFPGGCNIGSRPIDLHLEGFQKLGTKIYGDGNYIHCIANSIKGTKIKLEFPSVGATENIMLASIYANGTTQILNAAKEPEIVDLAKCLNKMGAKIYGAGTSNIKIIGVKKLNKSNYRIMPDRIEAGTFLCATAITTGEITIYNTNPEHLMETLYKLRECGCKVLINNGNIYLKAPKEMKAVNIETGPYPEFPTDMQPIFTAMLTKAKGNSKIKENIFENRFKFCNELRKMDANIINENNTIIVRGTKQLLSNKLMSQDLRGGAALIIASLAAEGKTTILNAQYILRGYENFEKKLNSIGAKIKLEKVV